MMDMANQAHAASRQLKKRAVFGIVVGIGSGLGAELGRETPRQLRTEAVELGECAMRLIERAAMRGQASELEPCWCRYRVELDRVFERRMRGGKIVGLREAAAAEQ